MITRRNVLRTALLGAAAGFIGQGLPLGSRAFGAETPDEWKAAFDAALKTDRRLLGWQGVTVDALETPSLALTGTLPEQLMGTFYRNGPARHERGGKRYRHWFDGDGMVQAFRIGNGTIAHQGRFVATAKLAEEEQAGHFILPAFGTGASNDSRGLSSPDELNPANISILHHAGELLALWEAGSAHVLDPANLDTRGKKVWRDDLKGMPFTAHPKVEPDGTLWSFGYDVLSSRIIIYHIGQDGAVRNVGVIAAAPLGMVHDAAVTAKHIVFALAPYVVELERFKPTTGLLDAHVWKPELGMRVLAIAKDDLKTAQIWQLPAGFNFHFGNAWEDQDGTIRFDYCVASDASVVAETFRYIMRGEFRGATGPTRFARVTLRPGKADGEQEIVDTTSEFPRVAPSVVGQKYRFVYTIDAPSADGFTGVMRWDLETGKAQRFDYGPDYFAEEHVFVPRPGGTNEDDGWLIGTALDFQRGVTTVNVFDAAHITDGPLARARLPYALPLGFHGQFVPA